MFPADLPEVWLKLAEQQDKLGAAAQASTLRFCAQALEESVEGDNKALLSLQEAAEETGYTPRHLRRLLEDGTLPNSGTPGNPRLQRSNLPRKPGHGIARSDPEAASSIAQVARAIATQGEE